jgi:hypothetical protein
MNLKFSSRVLLAALSISFLTPISNANSSEVTGIGIQMFDLQGPSLYARYCLQGSGVVSFQGPINTTSTITDASGTILSTKTSQWGVPGASSMDGDCTSANYAYDEVKSGFTPGASYTLNVSSVISGVTYSLTKSFTIAGGSNQGTQSFTNSPAVGGFAVVHPDGHVCGVIVGSIAYFGGNDRTMESEYMGCPIGARIIFQTQQSASGNVAGYSGNGGAGQPQVTYDSSSNTFSVSNGSSSQGDNRPTQVTLVIKDGVATDSTGRSFNTGTGLTADTTLTATQYANLVSEFQRIDRAVNQQSKALERSKFLARETPGLERCVEWQGSLEAGTECSRVEATQNSAGESITVTSRSVATSIIESKKDILVSDSSTSTLDSVTVMVKERNSFLNDAMSDSAVKVTGTAKEVLSIATKVDEGGRSINLLQNALNRLEEMKQVSSSRQFILPTATRFDEKAETDTPLICKIVDNRILKLKKGVCSFSYTFLSNESGNSFTVRKTVTFT